MHLKTPNFKTETLKITLSNGQSLLLPLVKVATGKYQMGGESGSDNSLPKHWVALDEFWIGQYPVTQAQWQAVMGENPSYFSGKNRPVEQVSWHDCQKFLEKLNQLPIEGDGQEGIFRLPTEAEWEYAARGGKDHWQEDLLYAGSNDLANVAWYDENSPQQTMPVGLKQPNPLGIYDMSGNVWEWCQDVYNESFYASPAAKKRNPINNGSNESNRVLRGGSWNYGSYDCRPSYRLRYVPNGRSNFYGFRFSRTLTL